MTETSNEKLKIGPGENESCESKVIFIKSAKSNSKTRNITESRKRSKKEKFQLNCRKNAFKKFRNVYTEDQLRKILENYKINYREEEEDENEEEEEVEAESCSDRSRKVSPAYFVLKLAESSRNNSTSSKDKISRKTQSFKLIFANDDFKKSTRCQTDESSGCSKSIFSVKMKDKMAQTTPCEETEREKNPEWNSQVPNNDFYLRTEIEGKGRGGGEIINFQFY